MIGVTGDTASYSPLHWSPVSLALLGSRSAESSIRDRPDTNAFFEADVLHWQHHHVTEAFHLSSWSPEPNVFPTLSSSVYLKQQIWSI